MDKFVEIDMDKIVPNKDNDKIFSMTEIKELADTIKSEGFFGGIEVFKIPKKDMYEISSGHRRYEAMKLLKRKTIPCIVSEYPSDYKKGIKMLASNIRTRKLSPLDMARAIEYYEKLLTKEGKKRDFKSQASKFFNMSPIQIYRHQCLLRIIPELQELANDPNFPYSAFREAATLSIEGQKQLYKEISYFLTSQEDDDDKEYKLTRPRIETLIGNIKENEQAKKAEKKSYKIPEKSTIDHAPLDAPIELEDAVMFAPRTISSVNEYKKPILDVKDDIKKPELQKADEKEVVDEIAILRISERISSLEEEINSLSDKYKNKCVLMIEELIKNIK